MQTTLFNESMTSSLASVPLGDGATILRGFALPLQQQLFEAILNVTQQAPLRHMLTPWGYKMSVAMTNCGALGWIADRTGYRYQGQDPTTQQPWPALPSAFEELARKAATSAGFPQFMPDACLINRYEPGARLSLHQDRNERGFDSPIVSVSMGIPAVFLWGGPERSDRTAKIPLDHGDAVVWGGPARLRYHGVAPLKWGDHPLTGSYRYNLTFRKAA